MNKKRHTAELLINQPRRATATAAATSQATVTTSASTSTAIPKTLSAAFPKFGTEYYYHKQKIRNRVFVSFRLIFRFAFVTVLSVPVSGWEPLVLKIGG